MKNAGPAEAAQLLSPNRKANYDKIKDQIGETAMMRGPNPANSLIQPELSKPAEDTMRTRIICILNLMIMSSSVVVFAGDFEGVIHMKTTFGGSAEGRTGDSDWYIKGDNIRTERRARSTDGSTGSRGGMIVNAETKKKAM